MPLPYIFVWPQLFNISGKQNYSYLLLFNILTKQLNEEISTTQYISLESHVLATTIQVSMIYRYSLCTIKHSWDPRHHLTGCCTPNTSFNWMLVVGVYQGKDIGHQHCQYRMHWAITVDNLTLPFGTNIYTINWGYFGQQGDFGQFLNISVQRISMKCFLLWSSVTNLYDMVTSLWNSLYRGNTRAVEKIVQMSKVAPLS